MSDEHRVHKAARKKATEVAFLKRIEDNLIKLLGTNAPPENINNTPFSLWLKAYSQALAVKFTIYSDEEYKLIKTAIISEQTNQLPNNLQQIIHRNNLSVRTVKLVDPRSLSTYSSTNIDAQSKELVSLKKKYIINNINDSSKGVVALPYTIVVPYSKIESTIKKIHSLNSTNDNRKDFHCSLNKTTDVISEYFSGIPRIIVREFINRCKLCQQKKIITEKDMRLQRQLQVIPEGRVFERLEVDLFFMNYSHEDGRSIKRPVIQVIDHKSKLRFARVLKDKAGEGVANFLKSIYAIIGPPRWLQSDNGKEFINEHVISLNAKWNVQFIHSSPYHPQTNGVVERANGVMKQAIRNWQDVNPEDDWTEALELIVHNLNSIRHETLGMSPYEYVFGVRPWNQLVLINNIVHSNISSDEDEVKSNDGNHADQDGRVLDHNNHIPDDLDGIPEDLIDYNVSPMPVVETSNNIQDFASIPSPSSSQTKHVVDILSSLSLGVHPQIQQPRTPSTHNTSNTPITRVPDSILSKSPPIQIIPKLHQRNSMHIQEQHDLLPVQDRLDEDSGRSFDHRQQADERYRTRVLGMKKAYDKKVKPTSFEVGQVVGIIIPKMYRSKFPTSYRKNHICGRIFRLQSYNNGALIKYKVRLQDHQLADSFNPHELVSLSGGAETFATEYSWCIVEDEVENLPRITFRSFVSESAASAHQTAVLAHNKSATVQKSNDIDVSCATCELAAPLKSLQPCAGCKRMIHKDVNHCAQGKCLIYATAKKIYCNIYCSGNHNFFPRLPQILEPNEEQSILNVGSVDSDTNTDVLSSKQLIDLTSESKIVSKKRKPSPPVLPQLSSPSALPPSKKTRIKEKKNSYYEIPTEEIQNITSFIKNYIDNHHITKPIRWTNDNIMDLQHAVSAWDTHIKDTTAILGRKINNHIKSHLPTSGSHPIIPNSVSTFPPSIPNSSPDVDDTEFDTTSVPSKPSSSSLCKACGEKLSPENWHRCNACKERIHGKIICKNGAKMYADDDKLYCSSACAPPELF
jgi:hypothetical protein